MMQKRVKKYDFPVKAPVRRRSSLYDAQFRIKSLMFSVLKDLGFHKLAKKIPFDYGKFWRNRYDKYGFDIMYCGNKGFNPGSNVRRREQKIKKFSAFLDKVKVNRDFSVLDVGCGVGIFTEYFAKNGFRNYKGIDLTRSITDKLKVKFRKYGYRFERKDIGRERIEGKYDLIIMMSVTQHIIMDRYFRFAMGSIQDAMNRNGFFFVTDMKNIDRRDSLYTIRRPLSYYKKVLDKLKFVGMIDYLGLKLFCFKKV